MKLNASATKDPFLMVAFTYTKASFMPSPFCSSQSAELRKKSNNHRSVTTDMWRNSAPKIEIEVGFGSNRIAKLGQNYLDLLS